MKNIMLIFAFVLGMTFCINAQTKSAPKKADEKVEKKQAEKIVIDLNEEEGGPVMEFEKMEVDYGDVEQHSEKKRYLSFKNTGTEPLVISNARGSCGCTVPVWPKQAIMPGQEDKLEISYSTNRLGKINKTITITTNEGGKPHVIKVIGNIHKKKEGLPEKKAPGFGG